MKSTTFPAPGSPRSTPKELFLDTAEREHATTLRVLRELPADRLDLKPSPKSMSARDLAYLFVREQLLIEKALTTGFDWSSVPTPPPPPETLAEIIEQLASAHARVLELVRKTPEQDLTTRTANFFLGPKTLGDVPLMDFIWMVLHDQIHHRGQLTVYVRMAGGKVPSIYGPSGDESWR